MTPPRRIAPDLRPRVDPDESAHDALLTAAALLEAEGRRCLKEGRIELRATMMESTSTKTRADALVIASEAREKYADGLRMAAFVLRDEASRLRADGVSP